MQIVLSELIVKYQNKNKRETVAVNKASAVFPSSSFNVVLGPSGCGKSTLLKAIAGSIDYDGDIFFDGVDRRDISQGKASLSYVPQEIHLYPFYTLFDNIAFPLKLRKTPRDEMLKKVREIAEELDIAVCLNVRPKFCSEGQRQRAMLARELVNKPKVALFDEPLSSLDPITKKDICSLLKKYQKEHGMSVIYVTHSFNESMLLADKLFLMENGEFTAIDTPMHLLNQGNSFLKKMEESEEMEVRS